MNKKIPKLASDISGTEVEEFIAEIYWACSSAKLEAVLLCLLINTTLSTDLHIFQIGDGLNWGECTHDPHAVLCLMDCLMGNCMQCFHAE